MTPSLIIRPATAQDAEDVVVYRAKLRAERLPVLFRYEGVSPVEDEAKFLRKFQMNPAWVFLVAIQENAVVGHLDLLAGEHPQTKHLAKLGMSVLGPYRSQGVGTRLLEAAFDWASRADLRRIELEVMSNNPRAIRLYERLGFLIEGRRRDAVLVDERYVDLVQMSRRVR